MREFIGSRGSPLRLLLTSASLSLAGCGDGPAFTTLFTTDHFVYHVEDGLPPPCDGADQWLERYYGANVTFLGGALPPGEKIDYYLAGSGESLQALGCPGASGCTTGTTIRTVIPVHPHEIMHANASVVGLPPRLFQEGLAVLMDCASTVDVRGPIDTSAPIEEMVETQAFSDWMEENGFRAYAAAGSFVRYLLDRFGRERFLSLYSLAPYNASRPWVEAVFLREMGVRLDDALSDWRKAPPLYAGDLCLRLMECDPSTPELADSEVAMGCGPLGGLAGMREALFRFEVPEQRTIHLTTQAVPAEPQVISNVSFFRCNGGDAIGQIEQAFGYQLDDDLQVHIDPAQPGRAFALDVPPGDYVAWLTAPGEARIELDIEERGSPMTSATCQSAGEPLALDSRHQTTLATRWIERPCSGPWCPGQSWDVSVGESGGALEAQALVLNGEANLSPGELYLCAEPCPEDASSCEILALDTATGQRVRSKQVFAPGAVVHVGAPAAPYTGHFAVRLRVAPE